MNIYRPFLLPSGFVFLFMALGFASCKTPGLYKSSVHVDSSYHSTYDDRTMAIDSGPVMMPYNRFIDPAGTVIRFGNKSLENHSLDLALLPGGRVLAVEDRYGLAFIDIQTKNLLYHLDYEGPYKSVMSTYSGLKVWEDNNTIHIFWGASSPSTKASYILDAVWNGKKASIVDAIKFNGLPPAPMALPNDMILKREDGETYMYIVLNGNSQLVKTRLRDKKQLWAVPTGMAPFGIAISGNKAYVSNWAGPVPSDPAIETAGIPYGKVYVDPQTGATVSGTVSVIDLKTGQLQKEINVGLHPNAIIASYDEKYIYVSNGNSDDISVISTSDNTVVETIPVQLNKKAGVIGDTPNALALDKNGATLYVANGLDNALVVVKLGNRSSSTGKGASSIEGFIPTEAYPAGIAMDNNTIYVANLEGEGARVVSKNQFSCHEEEATVSIIPVPDKTTLRSYTSRVEAANLIFRTHVTQLLPRKNVAPKPVPARIGEPSVFKHVVYIIKENKTYDQVLGDMSGGNGMKSLCIFGNEVTPNEHKLAGDYLLLDNYYASGKSSAEGHSWTDAAIVTDYIEKNVRAWFRSYPHVLADAMVYGKEGFIWNNALNHGKTVRIYGEACVPHWDGNAGWKEIYKSWLNGRTKEFTNTTTIAGIKPYLSPSYPGFDGPASTDQIKSDAFIKELNEYEKMPGDQLPQLMILALPADHTVGMREGFPTPRAMVADNDLALGKIIEALSKSRFWDSTVVFVTQDDPQTGWDHVSSYRTTGFVISPYSRLGRTVHTNYNQTCMVRTIEQILGLPPMNIMDETALPMFDCFNDTLQKTVFTHLPNNVPLDEMNRPAAALNGRAKKYSIQSGLPEFDHIDGGNDNLLNRIIWYSVMGKKKYPKQMTIVEKEDD